MAKNNTIRIRFSDLEQSMGYRFLEEGKDDNEIEKLAKKRGLIYPSPDLAFFKGEYAYTDEFNRNGCRLPKEEVTGKVLQTLVGKPIDIDHQKKVNCGMWVDAEVEKNVIMAYGCFWKSAFDKEFSNFQEKMSKGNVAISFEAWIDREYVEGQKYDAHNIHFCGGALLDKTQPAFPKARVLEFSAIMGGEKMTEKEKLIERAKVVGLDENATLEQVEAKEKEIAEAKVAEEKASLEKAEAEKKEKELADQKAKEEAEKKSQEEVELKAKEKAMSVINVAESKETRIVLDENGNLVNKEVIETVQVRTFIEAQIAQAVAVESAKLVEKEKELSELKVKYEEASKVVKQVEEAKAKEIEDAKKVEIAKRREELAEFAKELKDEEIMDSVKYEMAKKDKKISDLEKEIKEKSSIQDKPKETKKEVASLEIGVKTSATDKDAELKEEARKINELVDSMRK